MLGRIRTSDTRLVQGASLPLTQLSFQEPAGQRRARQFDPSGFSSPGYVT